MPQTKSRKKDLRQAKVRQERNRVTKKTARLALRAARESGNPQGPEVVAAYKAVDKSAKAGILHPRTAARRKARLMKQLNAAKPG
jgi:small subunit ribosomal protein S20